jgi:hypothetical protein
MKSIWLTYAWDDNKSGDVDYVAQELRSAGVDVKLDRWNLRAGQRLWDQIAAFIQNESNCDAWLLYATQNSLGSEACKEEYAYALDRALKCRSQGFPVLALFPSTVDENLIPAGIKIRLYVSLSDPDWRERIVATAENREPTITKPKIPPYDLSIHPMVNDSPEQNYYLEIRPRAGTWAPFIFMIPESEKDEVKPRIVHGPSGGLPGACMVGTQGEGKTQDGKWWYIRGVNQATPTQSYYIICSVLPSEVAFGQFTSPRLSLFHMRRENFRYAK